MRTAAAVLLGLCLGGSSASAQTGPVVVENGVERTLPPAEVERGARIVAAIDRRVPVFLTPLTEPESPRLTIETHDLVRLQAVASAHVADVRVLPQLHKVLGIP